MKALVTGATWTGGWGAGVNGRPDTSYFVFYAS